MRTADVDGDGDLDLVAAGSEGLHVLDNQGGNRNHWLSVRLQGLESATKSQRMSRGAARGLTYQTEMLRGRLALRALLQEAELCVSLRQNAQQFKERLQALVPRGREGGRGLGSGTDGLVLVDAAALRDARDAAASVQQAVRDAIQRRRGAKRDRLGDSRRELGLEGGWSHYPLLRLRLLLQRGCAARQRAPLASCPAVTA